MTGVPFRTQIPDLAVSPNRVGGSVIPNNPQPRADFDTLKHTVDDLKNSVAGLNQALMDSRLREVCREDWHRSIYVDTNANLVGTPVKIDAPKMTGGRPFNSLSVVGVGGGNLVVAINGEESVAVAAGDTWQDEIIYSAEAWSTAAAAGSARLRVGAYVGR